MPPRLVAHWVRGQAVKRRTVIPACSARARGVGGAAAAVADEGEAQVGAEVDHVGVADEPGPLAVDLPVRGVRLDVEGAALAAQPAGVVVGVPVGAGRAGAVDDEDGSRPGVDERLL
jgi:hypothetical protein